MGGAPIGNERGAGLFSVVLGLVVAGFLVWLGARVVPVYFEYWSISNVFQEQVRKSNLYDSAGELEKVILDELDFQDLNRLNASMIQVKELAGGGYRVSSDYEAEVVLSERVRLVFHFQPEAQQGG